MPFIRLVMILNVHPSLRASLLCLTFLLGTTGCFSSIKTRSETSLVTLDPIENTTRLGKPRQALAVESTGGGVLKVRTWSHDTCVTERIPRYQEVTTTFNAKKRVGASIAYGAIATGIGAALAAIPLSLEDRITQSDKVEPMARVGILASGVALGTTGVVAFSRGVHHARQPESGANEGPVRLGIPPTGSATAASSDGRTTQSSDCYERATRGANITLDVERTDGRPITLALGTTGGDGTLRTNVLALLERRFPGWPSASPGISSRATLRIDDRIQFDVDLAEYHDLKVAENRDYIAELERREKRRRALEEAWARVDTQDLPDLRGYSRECGDTAADHCKDASQAVSFWDKVGAVTSCAKTTVDKNPTELCNLALGALGLSATTLGAAATGTLCGAAGKAYETGKIFDLTVLKAALRGGAEALTTAPLGSWGKLLDVAGPASTFVKCIRQKGVF